MKMLKKGLAAMLAACMLLSMLPAALAAESADPETPAASDPVDEPQDTPETPSEDSPLAETSAPENMEAISFDIGLNPKTNPNTVCNGVVTNNSEAIEMDPNTYKPFAEDGSYTIQLEDNAFFPYQLALMDATVDEPTPEVVWFETPEDTVEYAGHTFRVASNMTSMDTLSQIGVWIDGEYIAARPEDKTFGFGAEMDSLLPLENKYFAIDLSEKQYSEQWRSVKLSTIISGTWNIQPSQIPETGKAVYASYRDDDSYSIFNENDTVDLVVNHGFNLIVGSTDQLNPNNVRYHVEITKNSWKSRLKGTLYNSKKTQIGEDSGSAGSADSAKPSGSTGLYYNISEANLKDHEMAYLKLEPATDPTTGERNPIADCDVKVYTGEYNTKEELDKAISAGETADITTQIWAPKMASSTVGYLADYTQTEPAGQWFTIEISQGNTFLGVECYQALVEVEKYAANIVLDNSYVYRHASKRSEDDDTIPNPMVDTINGVETKVYTLYREYLANKQKAHITYRSSIDSSTVWVAEGNRATLDEVKANAKGRTQTVERSTYNFDLDFDFSKGQEFTVANDKGNIWHLKLQTVNGAESAPALMLDNLYTGTKTETAEEFSEVTSSMIDEGKSELDRYSNTDLRVLYGDNVIADKYYVTLSWDSRYGTLSHIVEGNYNTAAEVNKAVDIKDKLQKLPHVPTAPSSSTKDNYYVADLRGSGKTFTATNTDGTVFHLTVRIESGSDLTPAPPEQDKSTSWQDVLFRVYGAKIGDKEFHFASNRSDNYTGDDYKKDGQLVEGVTETSDDMYLLPGNHDSYYGMGFQTILINDPNFKLEEVKPIFYAYGHRKVYAGTNATAETSTPVDSANENSKHDFSDGLPVMYSVVGEDKLHLKNYWVSFIKKHTGGSKLFVSGANDPLEERNVSGAIVRDVFLDDRNSNEHDIFVANIGDKDLTGLKVTLTNAQNIKLDDYWTVGEGSTGKLAPFTNVKEMDENGHYKDDRDNLYNIAKIRLLKPSDDEIIGDGEISGTLTITADKQQPVVFQLTGTAGNPRITTTEIPEAVQYVHYSALLQNNNRYRWNRPSYTLAPEHEDEDSDYHMPEGLELQENGEIYGVPMEYGEFKIKVVMNSRYPLNSEPVEAEFNLIVKENTDDNVDAASMDAEYGYEVLNRIPDRDTYSSSEIFRSEGIYSEYEVKKEVRIDGEKLEEGVDYDSEEGSTKITVRAQTLSKLSQGTHTLSVEFRNKSTKQMKRSAQNFKKGSGSSSSNNNTGNKGSGGGGGGKRKPSTNTSSTPSKPSTPSTPSQPKQSFTDVPRTDWSFNDVEWANTNGLMVGIGNEQFGPTAQISDAMVVSVLARLAKADLSAYTSASFEDIADGQWYSSSASWARAIGIIGSEPFQAVPPCPRGDLAVMLVRYFDNLKIPYSVAEGDVYLADAEQMNAEELKAFQILVKLGIIKGKGNNTMDPTGATTRAELAALLHRVSNFVAASGK